MTEYEKMGGTYRQVGDYILPNLTVKTEPSTVQFGIWAERHRRYLKEHHKVRYYNLLTAGTLDSYLADIESQAEKLFEQEVKSLAEKENVTESLKANSPTEWVRNLIIQSLISKKNALISAGKYTDGIDDTLLKILRSKQKKVKIMTL